MPLTLCCHCLFMGSPALAAPSRLSLFWKSGCLLPFRRLLNDHCQTTLPHFAVSTYWPTTAKLVHATNFLMLPRRAATGTLLRCSNLSLRQSWRPSRASVPAASRLMQTSSDDSPKSPPYRNTAQFYRHYIKEEDGKRTVLVKGGPRFAIADDYREFFEDDKIPVYE